MTDTHALSHAESFAAHLVHLLSLQHALALQHLRRDWHLDNIVAHTRGLPPPPEVCWCEGGGIGVRRGV